MTVLEQRFSTILLDVEAFRLVYQEHLGKVFDGIFISEQMGADKPSRIFFDKCLRQLQEQDKSRILIVGDSLTSDIAAARGPVLQPVGTGRKVR